LDGLIGTWYTPSATTKVTRMIRRPLKASFDASALIIVPLPL
jgi:hypothetical protein